METVLGADSNLRQPIPAAFGDVCRRCVVRISGDWPVNRNLRAAFEHLNVVVDDQRGLIFRHTFVLLDEHTYASTFDRSPGGNFGCRLVFVEKPNPVLCISRHQLTERPAVLHCCG